MALTVTKQTADEVAVSAGVAQSVTSVSPPAGSMVRWCVAYLNSNDTLGLTFTAADSHGTSFGAPTRVGYDAGGGSGGDGDGGCYLLIWDHTYTAAPGATTLTVTASGTGVATAAPSDCLILPYVITGQASNQSTAAFNSFSEHGTSTTTYEISLTTTQAGSQVFLLAAPNHNGGATGPVTPISGSMTDVDWDDATSGSRGTFGRATSLTTTPGPTTFGWTSGNPSPNGYGVMASEVLPAVTPITSVQSNSGGSGTGATTMTVTLGAGITQGNLVYVLLSPGYGTTVTPPSGWSQAGPAAGYGASGLVHMTCFYQVVSAATAGQTSWNFTWTGSHTPVWLAHEWHSSTGWAASPLDQVQGASSTSSTTVATGTTATTAQASELWVAGMCYDTDVQAESGLTSGWTQGLEPNITGAESLREAYQVATATGAAACQMTIVTATDSAGLVATFKPAAAAAPSVSGLFMAGIV